jgi:hypothetical protein
LAATIQECSTWFEDDARGALTNDVCNSIFASGGLPHSEVSGPTTSEVLLAEIIALYTDPIFSHNIAMADFGYVVIAALQ